MMIRKSKWPLPMAVLLALAAAGCVAGPDESCEEGCADEAVDVFRQQLLPGAPPADDDPVSDIDGDGHLSIGDGGDDCNDLNASIYPGANEICDDGVDSNCDKKDCLEQGICQSLLACKKEKP